MNGSRIFSVWSLVQKASTYLTFRTFTLVLTRNCLKCSQELAIHVQERRFLQHTAQARVRRDAARQPAWPHVPLSLHHGLIGDHHVPDVTGQRHVAFRGSVRVGRLPASPHH